MDFNDRFLATKISFVKHLTRKAQSFNEQVTLPCDQDTQPHYVLDSRADKIAFLPCDLVKIFAHFLESADVLVDKTQKFDRTHQRVE